MNIVHVLVLTFLIVVATPALASFFCVYQSGDISFDASSVLIERDGKDIWVFRVDSGKVERSDGWRYRVFAENEKVGLQAIRANPAGGANSPIAVEYGGLLFLIWGEGKLYAHVVSAQASTKKTQSQVLGCERR